MGQEETQEDTIFKKNEKFKGKAAYRCSGYKDDFPVQKGKENYGVTGNTHLIMEIGTRNLITKLCSC